MNDATIALPPSMECHLGGLADPDRPGHAARRGTRGGPGPSTSRASPTPRIARQLAMPIGTCEVAIATGAHRRLASMLGHLAEVAAMTSQPVARRVTLSKEAGGPGPYAPDAASAGRRPGGLRDLLADPDGWGRAAGRPARPDHRHHRPRASPRRRYPGRPGAVRSRCAERSRGRCGRAGWRPAAVVIGHRGHSRTRGPPTSSWRTRGWPRPRGSADRQAARHALRAGHRAGPFSGLPPLPRRGYYYQAWMKGPARGWSPSAPSTCVAAPGQRSSWWSAVSLTDYPAITVTPGSRRTATPPRPARFVLTNRQP